MIDTAQTTIEDMAAAMKTEGRAVAAKIKPAPKPVEEPKPKRVRAKSVRLPKESAPVVAIRRAIVEHEREIKRLQRALKAIGG
jgi:hypothetical protein